MVILSSWKFEPVTTRPLELMMSLRTSAVNTTSRGDAGVSYWPGMGSGRLPQPSAWRSEMHHHSPSATVEVV